MAAGRDLKPVDRPKRGSWLRGEDGEYRRVRHLVNNRVLLEPHTFQSRATDELEQKEGREFNLVAGLFCLLLGGALQFFSYAAWPAGGWGVVLHYAAWFFSFVAFGCGILFLGIVGAQEIGDHLRHWSSLRICATAFLLGAALQPLLGVEWPGGWTAFLIHAVEFVASWALLLLGALGLTWIALRKLLYWRPGSYPITGCKDWPNPPAAPAPGREAVQQQRPWGDAQLATRDKLGAALGGGASRPPRREFPE